jgi:hypothetical protein
MPEQTDAKVLPFARPARPATPARGRQLAAEQQAGHRAGYARAQTAQDTDRRAAAGRVVPARITMALDSRGLEGPDVDTACGTFEGNPAGDVDMWELALAVPTAEQVRAIAQLSGYPLAWFYEPLAPGPMVGPVRVCYHDRRRSVVLAPNVVDERGVLLYGGQPRTPPNPQGALF